MNTNGLYHKGNVALTICPICGHGKLFTQKKGWVCNRCGYIIYRCQLTVTLGDKDVLKLVNGWLSDNKVFTSLKGKKYHARLKLDSEGKVVIISSSVKYTNCLCPSCKGRIREAKNCYICENSIRRHCDFRIWKVWHGHLFTLEDVESLIANKQTNVYRDFRDTSGETYEGRLILNEKGKPILCRIISSHKQRL